MPHTIKNNQSGFTLIELAISILIFGLIFGLGITMMGNYLRAGKERTVIADFEVIADAVSIYTQANLRVPCPSTPDTGSANYGLERVNANGDCSGNEEGVIPFRTLGLSEGVIRDSFGRLMTYRVSPAASLSPIRPFAFWDALPIGEWCMTTPHWYDGANFFNIQKAAFCCGSDMGTGAGDAGVSTDIEIRGVNNTPVAPNRLGANSPANDYTTRNAVIAAGAPTQAQLAGTLPSTYTAYVVISHGENGFNAYTGANANRPAAAGSNEERENADGDSVFYASDRVSTQVGAVNLNRINFDDLVYWQSTAQVMSRFGGVSCNRP